MTSRTAEDAFTPVESALFWGGKLLIHLALGCQLMIMTYNAGQLALAASAGKADEVGATIISWWWMLPAIALFVVGVTAQKRGARRLLRSPSAVRLR